jgi:two-component system NtrC family sensor kinase
MQLQRKLFLSIGALTIIPLLILQFGVVDRNENALEDRVNKEILGTLDKLAAELETLLNAQKAMVRGLNTIPAVQAFAKVMTVRGETDDYRRRASDLSNFFLNYQAAVPSIQAIRILDAQGNSLVKVKEQKIINPKARLEDGRGYIASQGQRPFFQHIATGLSAGAIGISDFELGQVTPEAEFCPSMLRYLTPLYATAEKVGFLVVNIWGKRIDEVIAAILGGYAGQIMMVELAPSEPGRDGIYLYHPNPDMRFANQLGKPYRLSLDIGMDLWKRISDSGDEGSVQRGEQMYFFRKFYPYPDRDNHWLLVIQRDRADFLRPIIQVRQTIWALLAALVLLGLILARWSSQRMAQPVQHLSEIITSYANGEQVRYLDNRRDEIGQVGRAFNYLTDTLARAEKEREYAENIACQAAKMATVGELAAGVAHEINNPLNNMMSLTEMMETMVDQGANPTVLREDLNILRQEGRRCADIVQGLLDFARPKPPVLVPVQMLLLVEESIRLLASKARAASVSINLSSEPNLPDILGDKGQLLQVMVNLLLNAIQESPKGAAVQISLVQGENNYLKCLVTDQGRGLEQHQISRIFEPFYTTKQDRQGTGLGLSVSYAIIQRHGGGMGAHPGKEKGLVLWFTLPSYNKIENRYAKEQTYPTKDVADD